MDNITIDAKVVPGTGIVVKMDATTLAWLLVIGAQEAGALPTCFAPRDDLRVMDTPTWDDGALTFVLSTPERES